MVGQMVVPGVNSFAVLLAPYHNVTPIVTPYAAQQPRLENLTTPQEGGVAMAVVVVLMAEEVGVEVAEAVADLEMVATLVELMTLLWCHTLAITPGTWALGGSEPELGLLKQTSLAILSGLKGGSLLGITFNLYSMVLCWYPQEQQIH